MNRENFQKVYILGAGCSAAYGYPTARDFVSELENFNKSYPHEAARIKKCVEETAAIMRQESVQTLDDLAIRFHSGCFTQKSGVSRVDNTNSDQRIYAAKIAASALFLAKEPAAKKTGLRGYHQLLLEMFRGAAISENELRNSNCRVLTFNYDRLFEIAFLSRINANLVRKGIYGNMVLNAGFQPFGDDLRFADSGFCFLKLHGTVGGFVDLQYGEPQYHPYVGEKIPGDDTKISDLPYFTEPGSAPLPIPSLLVFPHEKQRVQAGGRHLTYQKYISAIWDKALKEISKAKEVWIIGYSFAELDRDSIVNMLAAAKTCERVIVQNLPNEAERLCRMLKIKHPELKVQWEPYPEPF